MNRISKGEVTYHLTGTDYYVSEKKSVHHIIKERGIHFTKGISERTLDLVKSYSIDKINFKDADLIIDVGANTGDLIPFFQKQRYIGFEPSPAEFRALEKNINSNCKIYNLAVGDIENETVFYLIIRS